MIKAFNFENSNQLAANTYVLGKNGGGCIIFDLGSTSNLVADFVKKNFKKVYAIMLTHGHLDHIRGVNNFLKVFPKTPVYIHEDDFNMLVDEKINGQIFNEEILEWNFEPILVKDGEVISFDDYKIEVIHTPFHTLGSVCYLSKEDNALFTGDTLFKNSIGRYDFSNSDPDKIQESLLKLSKLNELLVCYPGHGPITSLRQEMENNPYFRG